MTDLAIAAATRIARDTAQRPERWRCFEEAAGDACLVQAQREAEAADAKNIETQTTAALNERKPADEKQLDTNEELERQ